LKRIVRMIALTLVFAGSAHAECRAVNAQELKAYLAANPAVRELVFFAAWCRDCKGKLEAAGPEQALVAVFEEQDRAARIWQQVNKQKSPCFFDRDESVARAWSVSSLPFSAAAR
jgi:hypothetical protein